MAGQDVIIKPSDHNPAVGWKVKKNFMMTVTKGSLSAQPVALVAVTDDKKQSPLALNGKLEVTITPQISKAKNEEIVISKQGIRHIKILSRICRR